VPVPARGSVSALQSASVSLGEMPPPLAAQQQQERHHHHHQANGMALMHCCRHHQMFAGPLPTPAGGDVVVLHGAGWRRPTPPASWPWIWEAFFFCCGSAAGRPSNGSHSHGVTYGAGSRRAVPLGGGGVAAEAA
jgi:hypothetical protein